MMVIWLWVILKPNSNKKSLNDRGSFDRVSSFYYSFKPSFKIKSVLENSQAEKAGLLEGDLILKINNLDSQDLDLNKILLKFQEKIRGESIVAPKAIER